MFCFFLLSFSNLFRSWITKKNPHFRFFLRFCFVGQDKEPAVAVVKDVCVNSSSMDDFPEDLFTGKSR